MKALRLGLLVIAAAIVGALITLAVVKPKEAAEEEGSKAPERVTVENGEPTINLDEATQQKIGLTTVAAQVTPPTTEEDIFGTVLDVQDLATIENQIASARAQLEQANSKAHFDRNELSRLRALNADNKNVSDRAVQEAEANVAADSANASSANASIQASVNSAIQKFGPAIAKSLESQSELYRDLVSMQRVLIAFAARGPAVPPPKLHIIAPADVNAQFVSMAPRVDPKLQRPTYLFTAPAGSLSAGMTVTARFSSSGGVRFGVVPPGALISWNGKSWVYVRRDATHFVRREFSELKPGDQVVTSGAQQLLSEEMRAQLHEAD